MIKTASFFLKKITLHCASVFQQVWKSILPVKKEDVVLGQYTGNSEMPGYLEDDTIQDKNSKTPTFATCVLYIKNDSWDGVPFILKAGKALDDKKVDVRLQMRRTPFSIFQSSVRYRSKCTGPFARR